MHTPSGRGVLIVEDEQELRSLFAVLLEMEGYRVFQAEDGRQGLEFLQSNLDSINLIIADLNLPRMGGIDLIGRARTMNPAVICIAETSTMPSVMPLFRTISSTWEVMLMYSRCVLVLNQRYSVCVFTGFRGCP